MVGDLIGTEKPKTQLLRPIPVFAVGLAAGILLTLLVIRPFWGRNPLVQNLVSSHVRSLMGTDLVEVASSDRHTVKPWFSGKIDFSPVVADLAAEGFPLIGGRLEYLSGRRVAVLVYKRRLHTVNVFVGRDLPGPTSSEEDGFNVRHWGLDGLDYWAVTDAAARDLPLLEADIRGAATR
jgi:anti-sigma factor RsiW